MRLVVAWGVVPVLLLPVGNLSVLAQGIDPVAPGLAAQRIIDVAGLGCLDGDQIGQNVVREHLDGLSVKNRVVNVAGHVGPPLFGTS